MDKLFQTHYAGPRDALGLLLGLVIGWLAGLGVMMLFVPRPGKETRVRLHSRVTNTIDDLVTVARYDSRRIPIGLRGR
jgi:hypothetical protein